MPRAYHEQNPIDSGKSWLQAYVAHQRFSESPLSFHFWTGVATIAGALRRKVWIDQRHFQWTPNMYIVLVGPAGVAAKSTSLRAGLSLLENVQGVVFGPQSMTWQALIESFKNSQATFTPSDSDQPTIMSCITVGVGELGTFLDPTNRELIDLLTAMWDGQKEIWRRHTRKDGTTEIHNPWLNLIACTTPSWLKDRFPEVLIGGGLTSRIVFVYGEKKRQLIPYPSELVADDQYQLEEKALLYDLQQIADLCGEYHLDREALEWGDAWYRHHLNGGTPTHLASARFEGYRARKQTHVHKLAMVLAASKRNDLIITKDDLIEAERHITDLEQDMLHVFNSIGVHQTAKVTSEVVKLVKNHETITYKVLWRKCYQTMDQREFVNSLKAAVDAGQIQREALGGDDWKLTYVGR